MTIDFNLVALLDFLAFVQGTLLGILLMLKKKEHQSYFWLGLFLFTYSTELFVSVLIDLDLFEQKPTLIYLPVTFYFWFMPALYVYVKSFRKTDLPQNHLWLFLPGLLELAVILYLFLQPTSTKTEQFNSGWTYQFYTLYIALGMLYAMCFAGVIIRQISQHQKEIKNFYSNAEGKLLSWVKWICMLIIAIDLLLMSAVFVEDDLFGSYIYPITSACNVVFIFWIALSGFRQSRIDLHRSEAAAEMSVSDAETNHEEVKKEDNLEYEQILSYLKSEKIYTQSDLHLADLARMLHLSQRHLSETINQHAATNFNHFINQLRIEEAKNLLTDEQYAHLNILGIGFEVGFNSKTAFYTAFKKETGMTPAKFQKQNKPAV